MEKFSGEKMQNDSVAFIIIGASGDLSKKKIYPTLWSLYKQKYISQDTSFIGYARSKLSVDNLIKSFEQYMEPDNADKGDKEELQQQRLNFFRRQRYLAGSYDHASDFARLNKEIADATQTNGSEGESSRVFYLALPPSIFSSVTEMIRQNCWVKAGGRAWARIIIEKPFGHDLESSNVLSRHLSGLFEESEIYRIDHYLGKEMVKNLLVLRFGNIIFRSVWSRDCISSIQLTFKEPFGVEGRGGYFDDAGIIRDIIQNHLLQILSLIAMEKPLAINADSIRGEKLKALRAIRPLTLDNLVVGQYVGNPSSEDPRMKLSYKDVEGVPKDSITPTYACAVLYVNNERWEGVPFILRCGKALNERKAEIRVQFKDVPGDIFAPGQLKRNELVVRVQPGEAIYIKVMNKQPGGGGLTSEVAAEESGTGEVETSSLLSVEETELELTYNERYQHIRVPDAYENLIMDVFNGLQMDFVHMDELREAWRIVDGALKKLKTDNVKPFDYVYGSRNGPDEASELIRRKGVVYSGTYVYNKPRL